MFLEFLLCILYAVYVTASWYIVWNWKLKHIKFIRKFFNLSDININEGVDVGNINKGVGNINEGVDVCNINEGVDVCNINEGVDVFNINEGVDVCNINEGVDNNVVLGVDDIPSNNEHIRVDSNVKTAVMKKNE